MDDRQYHEVEEPGIRAAMIAHMLRVGTKPIVGDTIGFSGQLKSAEVDDVNVSIDQKTLDTATAMCEKVWFSVTITQADIVAGINLINNQKMTHKSEGKISQMAYPVQSS